MLCLHAWVLHTNPNESNLNCFLDGKKRIGSDGRNCVLFLALCRRKSIVFGVWNKLLEGDQSYKIKNGMQSGRCTRNGVARMVPCHKRFERIHFTHTAFKQFSKSFQTVLTIRLCPSHNLP